MKKVDQLLFKDELIELSGEELVRHIEWLREYKKTQYNELLMKKEVVLKIRKKFEVRKQQKEVDKLLEQLK